MRPAVPLACLLVSGVFAAPSARPVSSEGLRYASVLPAGWEDPFDGAELSPKRQPDPGHPMGIDVSFRPDPELDLEDYLKSVADPGPAQRAARGLRKFSGSPVRRKGAWLLVETRAEDGKGAPLREAHAVLKVSGGFYEVVFFAREPWFDRERPVFERFVKRFEHRRQEVPFRTYRDPKKRFFLRLPGPPWSLSRSDFEDMVRVVGPPGRGKQSPPIVSVRRFPRGKDFKDAAAYLRLQAARGAGRKPGLVERKRFPAGRAGQVEVVDRIDPKLFSERRIPQAIHLKTAYVVFERPGGLFVLSYKAPLSDYPEYLPAFKTVLKSLRFSD